MSELRSGMPRDHNWIWPSGEHVGKSLANTPVDYLAWCVRTFTKGILKKAIKREIARRDPELARRLNGFSVGHSVIVGTDLPTMSIRAFD